MLSRRTRLFKAFMQLAGRYYPRPTVLNVQRYRKAFERATFLSRVAKGVRAQSFALQDMQARWFYPLYTTQKVVLYLHGGALVMGSVYTHQGLMSSLAKQANCRVLGINYGLVPEHAFPRAIEDCVAAYRWLLNSGVAPADIVLAGDSAGGGLVVSTLLRLREQAVPLPAAGICLSPWLDLEMSGESFKLNQQNDPFLVRDLGEQIIKHYLKDTQVNAALASPLYADLSGLPPLYIQVSRAEVLYDDAARFTEKARAQNVEIILDVWEGLPHAWPLFQFLPEARQALEKIAHYIRSFA